MGPATAIYWGLSQSKIPEVKQSWEDTTNAITQVTSGAGDVLGGIYDTLTKGYNLLSKGYNLLSKYWYVPVVVGGVIIGYKLINNPTAQTNRLIAALAADKT